MRFFKGILIKKRLIPTRIPIIKFKKDKISMNTPKTLFEGLI